MPNFLGLTDEQLWHMAGPPLRRINFLRILWWLLFENARQVNPYERELKRRWGQLSAQEHLEDLLSSDDPPSKAIVLKQIGLPIGIHQLLAVQWTAQEGTISLTISSYPNYPYSGRLGIRGLFSSMLAHEHLVSLLGNLYYPGRGGTAVQDWLVPARWLGVYPTFSAVMEECGRRLVPADLVELEQMLATPLADLHSTVRDGSPAQLVVYDGAVRKGSCNLCDPERTHPQFALIHRLLELAGSEALWAGAYVPPK